MRAAQWRGEKSLRIAPSALENPARDALSFGQALVVCSGQPLTYRAACIDFSADFVQTYRGGLLRTQNREEGKVTIKKPGRMRWIYVKPERKEFVSDGVKVYSYIPLDQQVIVSSVPPDNEATTPALFLAGKGDIVRDFTAAAGEASVPGTVAIKLTPRRADPEFEFLLVSVDPQTLQIRALSTLDRQGGQSTLVFTNLKENTGISDKEFAFRVPRGVDVITNGQPN
jgi:outer membrane lipoprotein carrier protein